ncbi:MAG: phytanoyl-CoA dioxygenase family protein [Myxococcota bacterium]
MAEHPQPGPSSKIDPMAKLDAFYAPIRELGLEAHVAELDTYGYTVIPPDEVGPVEFALRVREVVLRLAEERTGVPHQLDRNGDHGHYKAQPQLDNQYLLYYLLFADPIFEEWLENPVLHALITFAMRDRGQLSSLTSFVKWNGEGYGSNLGLHSDSPASPEGVLPATHDAVCNGTLILPDYTKDDGAIAMVPGSHRLFRQPRVGEGVKRAVPVEAPMGSLIFWHGNTWHGAFPKKTDGLRLNLTSYICNRHLKTQERYQSAVPREMLARHDEKFARLLGADDPYGWDEKGPDFWGAAKFAARPAGASR